MRRRSNYGISAIDRNLIKSDFSLSAGSNMISDLRDLTYENMNDIIEEVTGEKIDRERWEQKVKGVSFHLMHHRGSASGIEISVRDVDWKKSFRRIRSISGLISIGRLKVAYAELRDI